MSKSNSVKLCQWQLGPREYCKLHAIPFDENKRDDEDNVKYCIAHQVVSRMAINQTRWGHQFTGAFHLNAFNRVPEKYQTLVTNAVFPLNAPKKYRGTRVIPATMLTRFLQDSDAVRRGTVTQQELIKLAKQTELDAARERAQQEEKAAYAAMRAQVAAKDARDIKAMLKKMEGKGYTVEHIAAIRDQMGVDNAS